MDLNQNETSKFGLRIAECGISRDATHRKALPSVGRRLLPLRLAPSAFTLTELLVVITIIAILASLITGAAINALNKAKQTRITLEIQQLSGAIEEFKNEYNAYPPNGMNVTGSTGLAVNDFVRMFKKSFPRGQEPIGLIRALAGDTTSGMPGNPTPLPGGGGMTSAESLYFWLGGFSSDPQFPISGTGGPSFDTSTTTGEVLESRNRRYEFDLGRLEPRDSNGAFHDTNNGGQGRFIIYTIGTVQRRINLWQYAPSGSGQPFVYVDVSRHAPTDYDLNLAGSGGTENIFAIKQYREGFNSSTTPTVSDIVFVNNRKFQILHAGLDDAWGNFSAMSMANAASASNASAVMVFPTGPFIGDIADTVGNFMTGTLEDEQE